MINIQPAQYYSWTNIREDILAIQNVCFDEELVFEEDDFKQFCTTDGNFVVIDNNKMVGYVMCEDIKMTDYYEPHCKGKKTFHLISMALLEPYRGKGIASDLIRRVKMVSYLHNYDLILLDATSKGMLNSALKNGFVEVEFFPEWNGDISSHLMVWVANKWLFEN